MDKLTLIFSDIEAGGGTVTDDFVEEELFCNAVRRNFVYLRKYPTDLVLNGDFFDFMKCPYKESYPRHITEEIVLWKLNKVYKAHPLLFKTLKDFLKASTKSRIIFIVGNHDFGIVYPKVQDQIVNLITGKNKILRERILFPGFEFTDNLVHIEHGSQLDPFFCVDPEAFVYFSENLFIGEPFLLLPWGYNALYDFYIHIKEEIPLAERLKPRGKLLLHMPSNYRNKLFFGVLFYLLKSFFLQFEFPPLLKDQFSNLRPPPFSFQQ